MYKVFIDGSSGTTGLRIADRLAARPDIQLLSIDAEGRKDVHCRAEVINRADLAFLCLPDDAAREVMPLVSPDVKILDTSTAHRVSPGWVYGLPELHGQREKILHSNRVAVPGCYATGFITLAAPMVQAGLLPADYPFVCQGLSGYSGAGKSGIASYQAPDRAKEFESPRPYALGLSHKHLPEMQAICGLTQPPIFCPVVDDYYSGMEVTLPLHLGQTDHTPAQLSQAMAEYYAGEAMITVHPLNEVPKFLPANTMADQDNLHIYMSANTDGSQMLLISLFDNLGKGSSGAALQCMNLLLGTPETTGLVF